MMVKRLLVSCERRHPLTTIGISIPRLGSRKLLTGAGQYTADVAPADAAHAVFVRSPHAHPGSSRQRPPRTGRPRLRGASCGTGYGLIRHRWLTRIRCCFVGNVLVCGRQLTAIDRRLGHSTTPEV